MARRGPRVRRRGQSGCLTSRPVVSGKSHLARVLGARLGLTPVHLDVVYYDKDWKPLERETFAELQRDLITAPRWIIDGELRRYPADPAATMARSPAPPPLAASSTREGD